MAVPGRTVKDIRTNSGRVDQISQPYRAFMRISALEMEKARRGMERKSAMERIDQIDARFREIEGEKRVLLGALGEHEPEVLGGTGERAGRGSPQVSVSHGIPDQVLGAGRHGEP